MTTPETAALALQVLRDYCRGNLPEVADLSGSIVKRGDDVKIRFWAPGGVGGTLIRAVDDERERHGMPRVAAKGADGG